jgi:tetratricopeptide (TPR) repeat protein
MPFKRIRRMIRGKRPQAASPTPKVFAPELKRLKELTDRRLTGESRREIPKRLTELSRKTARELRQGSMLYSKVRSLDPTSIIQRYKAIHGKTPVGLLLEQQKSIFNCTGHTVSLNRLLASIGGVEVGSVNLHGHTAPTATIHGTTYVMDINLQDAKALTKQQYERMLLSAQKNRNHPLYGLVRFHAPAKPSITELRKQITFTNGPDAGIAAAHHNLANTLIRTREYKQAIVHGEKAVELHPNAEAFNDLGVALANYGDRKQATRMFRQAIRMNPNYSQAHFHLANALYGPGKYKKSIEHYLNAVRIDPEFALAHLNLASTLLALGRHAEAASHFAEAQRLNAIRLRRTTL